MSKKECRCGRKYGKDTLCMPGVHSTYYDFPPYHRAHVEADIDWRWDCSACNPEPDVPLTGWHVAETDPEFWATTPPAQRVCGVCGTPKNEAGYHVWPE